MLRFNSACGCVKICPLFELASGKNLKIKKVKSMLAFAFGWITNASEEDIGKRSTV